MCVGGGGCVGVCVCGEASGLAGLCCQWGGGVAKIRCFWLMHSLSAGAKSDGVFNFFLGLSGYFVCVCCVPF